MSDPRYTDPLDPRRPAARQPLEDDSGSGTMWSWIIGIIAIVVVAMMVYGYNKPISTAGNPPAANSSTTTGAAPAPTPSINPPVSAPTPAPATPEPAPAGTPR